MGGTERFYRLICCGCKKKKKSKIDRDHILLPDVNDTLIGDVIQKANLCIDRNGKEHRTSKYFHMRRDNGSNLVVRRGQGFRIEVILKVPYNADDAIHFTFSCSNTETPNFLNGTLVVVSLSTCDESLYSWKAILNSFEGNILIVDITPSLNCIVAKWNMQINYKQKDIITSFELNKEIYILFNLWCEEDQVFMESDEWKEEAVLNSDGLIWRSVPPSPGTPWNYAQFDEDILDCALYLFTDFGKLRANFRSAPVQIARKLSAMMNVNDDHGVLVGKWQGGYKGGVSPMHWTGSRDILQQFYRTKQPVKYGQCWAFSGILTSVCRALGIPARTVTNFDSAHDTDGSITSDTIIDDDGKIVAKSDSIWNFHVWSEVWMKRPDLGEGCDGWQALDATPQERSDGVLRCGPASVAACKSGDIHKPYDIPFVFSEVNADEVLWKLDSNNNLLQLIRKTTNTIGKYISTKVPEKFERLDVSDTYKFQEDSPEERATYLKAMRQVEHIFGKSYVADEFEEVVFKFKYYDDITVGQNFEVSLLITNTSNSRTHDVTTTLRLDVFSYTGKYIDTVKHKKQDVPLSTNSEEEVKMSVMFENYKDYLKENCVFVISSFASVANTNWYYFDRDNVQIKKPTVAIDITYKSKIGKEVQGYVTIRNPLPVPLKKGRFLIEAPGVGKLVKIKLKKDILPDQQVKEVFTFTPQTPGLQTIAAKFISKQLEDVEGFLQVFMDT